jgi:hypothetical protein
MASVLIVVLDTSNRVYCIATLIVCTVQCSAQTQMQKWQTSYVLVDHAFIYYQGSKCMTCSGIPSEGNAAANLDNND